MEGPVQFPSNEVTNVVEPQLRDSLFRRIGAEAVVPARPPKMKDSVVAAARFLVLLRVTDALFQYGPQPVGRWQLLPLKAVPAFGVMAAAERLGLGEEGDLVEDVCGLQIGPECFVGEASQSAKLGDLVGVTPTQFVGEDSLDAVIGEFVDIVQDDLQVPPCPLGGGFPLPDERFDVMGLEAIPRKIQQDVLFGEQTPEQALVKQFGLLAQVEVFGHWGFLWLRRSEMTGCHEGRCALLAGYGTPVHHITRLADVRSAGGRGWGIKVGSGESAGHDGRHPTRSPESGNVTARQKKWQRNVLAPAGAIAVRGKRRRGIWVKFRGEIALVHIVMRRTWLSVPIARPWRGPLARSTHRGLKIDLANSKS